MPTMDILNQLLQNKLFLQYLSGVGADIAGGGTGVQAANQITQQNISAQNMAQLFSKMLGGQIPDGGKVTMDKDGMKLNVPSSALGQGGFGGLGIGNPKSYTPDMNAGMKEIYPYGAPAGNEISPSSGTFLEGFKGLGSLLNPSSGQPNISASDLAGLSPKDIATAFQGALNVEELKQKKVSDVADMILKVAQAKNLIEPDGLESPYPIPVTIGNQQVQMSTRQWSNLPLDVRQYSAYVASAKMLGDSKIMTKEEFDLMQPTDRQQFLEYLQRNPEAMRTQLMLNREGATRISVGEKVETATKIEEAKAEQSGRLYFKGSKWIDDVAKQFSTDDNMTRINLSDNPGNERNKVAAEYIISKIRGGGGTIINSELTSTEMIWTVRWSDGKKETIRYALHD